MRISIRLLNGRKRNNYLRIVYPSLIPARVYFYDRSCQTRELTVQKTSAAFRSGIISREAGKILSRGVFFFFSVGRRHVVSAYYRASAKCASRLLLLGSSLERTIASLMKRKQFDVLSTYIRLTRCNVNGLLSLISARLRSGERGIPADLLFQASRAFAKLN